MNQTPLIPWAAVISNFVWILGAAIILAAFSFHEYQAHAEKAKLFDVLKQRSFKKPLYLGLIFVSVGIAASIHSVWLSTVFGASTILFIVSLRRLIWASSKK